MMVFYNYETAFDSSVFEIPSVCTQGSSGRRLSTDDAATLELARNLPAHAVRAMSCGYFHLCHKAASNAQVSNNLSTLKAHCPVQHARG